jgi:hypothetical protein
MKVGLIFECGPNGADLQVCEYLLRRLNADAQSISITLDYKKRLLRESGKAAANLIAVGCEKVAIVWDLNGSGHGEAPCLRRDREAILDSLRQSSVPIHLVVLVCIVQELESWLLADERALSTVIGSVEHPVRIPATRKPERIKNPKKRLNRLFLQHSGRPYIDLRHAKMIVARLEDFARLRRCPSFVRFAEKAGGVKFRQ